jgi:hypothetical protein
MSGRDTTLGRRLGLGALIMAVVAGCQGDKPAPLNADQLAMSRQSTDAGPGVQKPDAGQSDSGPGERASDGAIPSSPPDAAAGAGAAAPHVCMVPDDLPIDAPAADGGAPDPACHDVPRTIVANSCIGGICHDSVGPPAGMLDLMQPCVADRLVNVVSECQGELLIDPQQPSASFLLDKIESDHPACGESMPFTGHLPVAQQHCIDAWVHSIARYLAAH